MAIRKSLSDNIILVVEGGFEFLAGDVSVVRMDRLLGWISSCRGAGWIWLVCISAERGCSRNAGNRGRNTVVVNPRDLREGVLEAVGRWTMMFNRLVGKVNMSEFRGIVSYGSILRCNLEPNRFVSRSQGVWERYG